MKKQIVAVGILAKEFLAEATGFLTHGDRLHRQYIAGLTLFEVSEEIGDAVPISTALTGDIKTT